MYDRQRQAIIFVDKSITVKNLNPHLDLSGKV